MATLQTAAGGVLGAGGTTALYKTMDMQDGEPNNLLGDPDSITGRLSRPSVLFGLGGGLFSAGMWYLDNERIVNTPDALDGLWQGMVYGGVPAGAAAALFPAEGEEEEAQTETQTMTLSRKDFEDAVPNDVSGSGSKESSSRNGSPEGEYTPAGGSYGEAK